MLRELCPFASAEPDGAFHDCVCMGAPGEDYWYINPKSGLFTRPSPSLWDEEV